MRETKTENKMFSMRIQRDLWQHRKKLPPTWTLFSVFCLCLAYAIINVSLSVTWFSYGQFYYTWG